MLDCKTVVFLNISLHNIVTYREQVIDRMRMFFREMLSKNYILLWRPHPQLRNQLKSIDEALYEEYILVEKYFLDNKCGILDENEEIDWAMEVADIYYGDPGSVYNEFLQNNKPAIMLNMSGLFFPIGINLYNNECLYGIDHDYGAIVKYDIEKNMWEHCKIIPGYGMGKKLYHQAIEYKSKMIFSPYFSNELMIYDVSTNEISLFKMPLKEKYLSKKKSNFLQMLIKDDVLYLMPAGYRAMLCFDLLSYEFIEFIVLDEYIGDSAHMSFSYCAPINDTYFAVASFVSNVVLLVEYKTGRYKVKRLGKEEYRFTNIVNYRNDLWLTTANHTVVIRWNYQQDEEEVLDFFPDDFEMYNGSIFNDTAALIYDGKLYCVPARSNMGIVVDLDKKEIRENTTIKPYTENVDKNISIFDTHCHSDQIFYLQHQSYAFLIYDVRKEEIAESNCKLNAEQCLKKEIELIDDLIKQLQIKHYE